MAGPAPRARARCRRGRGPHLLPLHARRQAGRSLSLPALLPHVRPRGRFFGNFGFGGGGFGFGQEEEQTPKGHNVVVELEVTLKDLYLGNSFKVGSTAALLGGTARWWSWR